MGRRATVLAMLFTLMTPAAADAAFEAAPFVGAMIPTQSLLVSGDTGYLRMETHTVYGLCLATSLTPRIDAEAVLGAGTGQVEAFGALVTEFSSTVFLADLRLRTRLAGDDRAELGLVLGVGYTDVEAGFFDPPGNGTFVGRLTGVAGLGLQSALTDRLQLRLDVVDRIHAPGAEVFGAPDVSEKTQNDVLVTLGVGHSF